MPVLHTRQVQVVNAEGLHLRPATAIARFVGSRKICVEILRDGLSVDAGSVLDLITLTASQGTTLTLQASGDDAGPVLDDLARFFASGFDGTPGQPAAGPVRGPGDA